MGRWLLPRRRRAAAAPICTLYVACRFVAELIRVWYDNASLETYKGTPDARHVIVCGDTNVSRLRALADQVRPRCSACMSVPVGMLALPPPRRPQYFHKARDPDTVTPLVVMGDVKPEGALRIFIDQYKHSGQASNRRRWECVGGDTPLTPPTHPPTHRTGTGGVRARLGAPGCGPAARGPGARQVPHRAQLPLRQGEAGAPPLSFLCSVRTRAPLCTPTCARTLRARTRRRCRQSWP